MANEKLEREKCAVQSTRTSTTSTSRHERGKGHPCSLLLADAQHGSVDGDFMHYWALELAFSIWLSGTFGTREAVQAGEGYCVPMDRSLIVHMIVSSLLVD